MSSVPKTPSRQRSFAFSYRREVFSEQTSKEQKEFLKQSIAGLAEEGKVICVRLALFAEMMKSKTWTPSAQWRSNRVLEQVPDQIPLRIR